MVTKKIGSPSIKTKRQAEPVQHKNLGGRADRLDLTTYDLIVSSFSAKLRTNTTFDGKNSKN